MNLPTSQVFRNLQDPHVRAHSPSAFGAPAPGRSESEPTFLVGHHVNPGLINSRLIIYGVSPFIGDSDHCWRGPHPPNSGTGFFSSWVNISGNVSGPRHVAMFPGESRSPYPGWWSWCMCSQFCGMAIGMVMDPPTQSQQAPETRIPV